MALDWIQYNLDTGDYDATADRDENSIVRASGPPKLFRYELQGPSAVSIVEKLIGGPVPDIKLFNLGTLTIAGVDVRAFRHGMAGQPGFGGYIANESALVSLATVDPAQAQPGTEVTVIWGEEPNSTKPQVEPHTQIPIRATVAPAPYVEFARSQYRAPSATPSR